MDQQEEGVSAEEFPVEAIIRSLMAGFMFIIVGFILTGSKPTTFQVGVVVGIAILVTLVVYMWQAGRSDT